MNRRLRLPLLALLTSTLCLSGALPAQQQQRQRMSLPDSTTVTVTAVTAASADNRAPEIPFTLINNHLILPVSVNGSPPLDVVLDTGMPVPGLALYGSPKTKTLDLDIDPSIQAQVGGAGGQGARYAVRIALQESVSLPGVSFDKTPVIVMPAMPDFSGYHDGIMGYSVFGRFVVELDYDRRVMRLHDPETYKAPPEAHVVPMTVRNNQPYVSLQITPYGQEPFDAELVVIDLGASHAISMNTDWSKKVTVPAKSLKTIVGLGLSGPVQGEVGRLAALRLGDLELEDVLATFPASEHQNPRGTDSLAGNLGSEVLRRFKTTFDYRRGRLILEPNKAFSEPFKYDRAGLRLVPGKELQVKHVIPGSPADESGLEVDDVVTHLNGKAVSSKDYEKVRKVLLGTGEARLSLRRGEEILEKTVMLRPLI